MDEFLYKYDLMLEELHDKLITEKPTSNYWFSLNHRDIKFDCSKLSNYAELESIFRNFKKSLEINVSKDNKYSDILSKSLNIYFKFIDTRIIAERSYLYSDNTEDDNVSIRIDKLNNTKDLIINADNCIITYQFQTSEINRIDQEQTSILDEFINDNKSKKHNNVVFVHITIEPLNGINKYPDDEFSVILDSSILTEDIIDEMKIGTILKITNNAIFDSFVGILEKIKSYSSLADNTNVNWDTIFNNNIIIK